MDDLLIAWDDEDDLEGNVQHIAEHGLTIGDVEHVLLDPQTTAESASTGRPIVFGFTPSGEYIAVVFEWIDNNTIYPITAYETPEPI